MARSTTPGTLADLFADLKRRKLADVAERVGWTMAEAGVGYLIVYLGDIDAGWVIPITTLLALVKAQIALRLGSKVSASTLPESLDPAAPTAPADLGPQASAALGLVASDSDGIPGPGL